MTPARLKAAMCPRARGRARRWIAAAAAAALLAACESGPPEPLGTVGHVEGFLGRAAGDDALAVQVAREVLSAGGTAADAAVGLYFTLAVTLPSRAGLGGGGACVVHDHESEETEALEFLPRAPSRGGPVAIPGNLRGFAGLHERYGRLRWEQLLAPAENLARRGHSVSKGLAHDLDLAAAHLLEDAPAARIFTDTDGNILTEGDTLLQTELGVLISELRTGGAEEFYEGMLAPAVARRLTAAAGAGESALTAQDLRDYAARWMDPVTVAFDEARTMYFAPAPAAAGTLTAQMWEMLSLDGRYREADEDLRPHLFAEVSMRAFADRARWLKPGNVNSVPVDGIVSEERAAELLDSYDPGSHTPAAALDPRPKPFPENPAAAGFVVVDREGSAVACSLTMNNLFGLGRVAAETGIVAAAPPSKSSGITALLPMVMLKPGSGAFVFAGAASGGAAAPAALTSVVIENVLMNRPLTEAMSARRLLHNGVPDVVIHEAGVGEDVLAALSERGHRLHEIRHLGRVNAVSCPGGLPASPESCEAKSDPRGFGAALTADE